MNVSVIKLFHLAVDHSYFSNNSALSELEISTVLGDNLPKIDHRKGADNVLFFSRDVNPLLFKQSIIVPLTSSDPLFFNYTKLDLGYKPENYANIQIRETFPHQVVCLQVATPPDQPLKADEKTAFPLHFGQLEARFKKWNEKDQEYEALRQLELKNNKGETSMIVPPEPNTPCTIDLPSGVNGILHLSVTWSDDTRETYTFFAIAHPLSKPPLAILVLNATSLVSVPEDSTVEKPSFLEPTYTLLFQPRAVIFRYFIIVRGEVSLDGAQIELQGDKAPDVRFGRADDPVSLPDGSSAIVYTSDKKDPVHLIDLEQRPDYRIHLNLPDARFSGMTLPFPDARNIQPKQDDPSVYYGDVYVYL